MSAEVFLFAFFTIHYKLQPIPSFMHFHIITLFPESFDSYLAESIIGRAKREKTIKVDFYNPRRFVTGKYRKVWPDGNISSIVDDRPYGGGPGMVMRAEPVLRAVEQVLRGITNYELRTRLPTPTGVANGGQVKKKQKSQKAKKPTVLIINFTPSGEKLTTTYIKKVAQKYTDIILICGRYEGIDARVNKALRAMRYTLRDISIGDYVVTGGELPAMLLIDTLSRQIPGVLGKFESLEEERTSSSEFYTRPEILVWPPSSKTTVRRSKKYKVPKVLLSGDHKKIEEWKKRP